jgi:hypothetical protein
LDFPEVWGRNMSTGCSSHHCQYAYHASAYGLAGEIERPIRQSVTTQAACTLSYAGGRGSQRTGKFCTSPFICFDAAYTEVGGSFDDCHGKHTTYAHSVIEGLNIAEVLTADRVVSRMVVYSPQHGDPEGEHSYNFSGSHFDNLRIAGHPIQVDLTIHEVNDDGTYTQFENAYHGEESSRLLPWGNHDPAKLTELSKTYHALKGIGEMAQTWTGKAAERPRGGIYWSSVVEHAKLQQQVEKTEMDAIGGMILIPKFGVIRLGQLLVHKDYRRLTMFHVQMCSGSTGSADGGGTTAGGSRPFP